jgi:hypothetical protein
VLAREKRDVMTANRTISLRRAGDAVSDVQDTVDNYETMDEMVKTKCMFNTRTTMRLAEDMPLFHLFNLLDEDEPFGLDLYPCPFLLLGN